MDGVAEAEFEVTGYVRLEGSVGYLGQAGTYIFPLEYCSATTSLMNHFEALRISAWVSSPMKSRTLRKYSSIHGETLGPYSRVGNRMNIHSSRGLTMRTMTIIATSRLRF